MKNFFKLLSDIVLTAWVHACLSAALIFMISYSKEREFYSIILPPFTISFILLIIFSCSCHQDRVEATIKLQPQWAPHLKKLISTSQVYQPLSLRSLEETKQFFIFKPSKISLNTCAYALYNKSQNVLYYEGPVAFKKKIISYLEGKRWFVPKL